MDMAFVTRRNNLRKWAGPQSGSWKGNCNLDHDVGPACLWRSCDLCWVSF